MSKEADKSVADPRPPTTTGFDPSRAIRVPRSSMRIQYMSDLHVDCTRCPMPHQVPGVDAVVVAGDTCSGVEPCFAYLRAAFPAPLPLIVVLGNREFRGRAFVTQSRRARSIAPDYDITLLDDRAVEMQGVRFVGSTLWTDYRLHGENRQLDAIAADARRGDLARMAMSDRPWKPFTPLDAVARFEAGSAFVARSCSTPFDGPTVVVSHHAPSARSLDPRFVGGARDASYASGLDHMILGCAPALWIHGHVHRSCDYGLCSTRVVCNAKGATGENPTFDPSVVVEVAR